MIILSLVSVIAILIESILLILRLMCACLVHDIAGW